MTFKEQPFSLIVGTVAVVGIGEEINSILSSESVSSPANRPRSADDGQQYPSAEQPRICARRNDGGQQHPPPRHPHLLWSDPVDHGVFFGHISNCVWWH